MVDFALSDEHKALVETARRFSREKIATVAAECDRDSKFPMDVFVQAHELGIVNPSIPTEYGGSGLGELDNALLTEQMAWGCTGIQTSITANQLALTPIRLAGNDDQKKKYLGLLANEPVMASYATSEPDAGSDVAGLKTKFKQVGDDFVLNGQKCWITNASHARFYVIFATADQASRHKGIAAFIVDRDSPGFRVGKKEDKLGQRASDTAQIFLEDVVVPKANLLAPEGQGFKLAMETFNQTRPDIAAGATGLMQRCIDESVAYAKERKTFGTAIGNHQLVQWMLAEMAIRCEGTRLLYMKAGWSLDNHVRDPMTSSIAKAYGADSAMATAVDAVQIFGGNGYVKEYPVEKLMRDAKVLQIYEGTSQIQRIVIAKQMLSERLSAITTGDRWRGLAGWPSVSLLAMERLAVPLALVVLAACGDGDGRAPDGPGSGGAASAPSSAATTSGENTPIPVTTDAGVGGGGEPLNPDNPFGCVRGRMPSRPNVIPEGYLPYTCWSRQADCILWVAPHPETDTPPVEWAQPCADGSPGGDGCRQLVQNWGEGRRSDIGIGPSTRPEIDTLASPPLLRLARYTSDDDPDRRYGEWMVTELDGPMRWAMRDMDPSTNYTCAYVEGDLNEGVWTFTATGDGSQELSTSDPTAALVIDLEASSIELVHRDYGVTYSWFGGRELLVSNWGALEGYRRPGDEHVTIYDWHLDPIGGDPTSAFHLVGDRAVFEVSHNGLGVRTYDPERGQRELVPIGDDPSRGTFAPGTDSIDLVWTEGSGREPDDLVYPVRSIMTSPFTTDPDALQPRRLRSDVSAHDVGAGDQSWVVGCGRAARSGPGTKDIRIVRLVDGYAWYLPENELVWQAISVAGLTCDEVFLTVQHWTDGEPQGTTVQRIRLDALGEGVHRIEHRGRGSGSVRTL